ncbi:hypothetical protein DMH04_00790 [Kibdelosporangium aridum]|uniref:Three-Cys-motif partner protein n=1 Tax=Kibdelosporangium aridum TaxID=2030 RepID=A0A428ZU06_KIBAR|nr:hypothetical protein [Kibdelosporangium aridum]RSM91566.1 hypothetical protein DMH04_00790 [Kibdelosporangium aridum]
MSERVRRPDPHLAVKREVLVRYLDAWTVSVLRSHRSATYVESGTSVFADAFQVFGEFADRLDGHQLDMLIVGTETDLAMVGEAPAGLSVRSVADPANLSVAGPALAYLDVVDSALTEQDAWQLVGSLARGKAREVLLALPAAEHVADHRERLRAAGPACMVTVELVAEDGRAQLLAFATGDSKHLATFKNELWAVDEFAGIRYRDPLDTERTAVNISLTPQLRPLRRVLLAELARRGSCTVAELQQHTLLETIYRPADAIGALTAEATAGGVTREPAKGRLTPRTVVGHLG